jgi:hypothetical protein
MLCDFPKALTLAGSTANMASAAQVFPCTPALLEIYNPAPCWVLLTPWMGAVLEGWSDGGPNGLCP